MATKENLKEAFAGESQANRKYLAFAKQADLEGFPEIARLFRAAAEAETVHAHAHLDVLDGVGTTAENLQTAIHGEGMEFQEMYPDFLAEAEKEGNQAAAASFSNALAVERIHHGLYTKALETLQGGKDIDAAPIYVCPVCGNTVLGVPPVECPICGTARDRFMEIK